MLRPLDAISRIFSGLRFRLLLLVLMAVAPLVGLRMHDAARERRRVMTAWSEEARKMNEFARREELALRKQAGDLLQGVSDLFRERSDNREAFRKSLNEMLADYPAYANLGIVATNGEVLASSRPFLEVGGHDRHRFLRRALSGGARLPVSDYTIDLGSGKPAVTFACPILDDGNHAQAVAVATVKLEWLGRARSELHAQLAPKATWIEIDRSGIVLVCFPASQFSSGQRFPGAMVLNTVFGQQAGIVKAGEPGGTPALVAFESRYSQLVRRKVATLVSISPSDLFAATNQALARSLGAIGIATGLALLLGWIGSTFLVMRPVKALVRASHRLAAGDLSARTGLRHGKDELGQLTRVFDHMAQAVEQRDLERQLAEETLQARDSLIRELPLHPAAVCVCDRFGALELYNHAAVELWGCDPRDPPTPRRFCGSHLLFNSDGTPLPHTESPAAEVLRTGVAVRNRELLIGRPDGTRIPVWANVVPLRDGEGSVIGVVSCYQDLTERKQAEEKLRESNDRLQSVSRRLVESQELERRHIARELHDEVGQTLTVAGLNLQAAVQSPRKAGLAGRLKESLEAVERVLEQVRGLSLSLRPSMLDDLGLEPALRWYLSRQASAAGLSAQFRSDPLEQRLDPLIETACFRIAQEALTNIVRHARARSVSLELRRQNGQIHLFVRDDGVGFDVSAVREQAVLGTSLGLLSMEERATLSDGGLEFNSASGRGTEVHAWFPLKWRAEAA